MTVIALDSNLLVYAESDPDPLKGSHAVAVIAAVVRSGGVVSAQVFGEFLNVIRRKRPERFPLAIRQVEALSTLLTVVDTSPEVLLRAADIASRHKLQFWDAVIWSASAKGGARVLLSEDMQDGLRIGAVTAINPFRPENAAPLRRLLPTLPV